MHLLSVIPETSVHKRNSLNEGSPAPKEFYSTSSLQITGSQTSDDSTRLASQIQPEVVTSTDSHAEEPRNPQLADVSLTGGEPHVDLQSENPSFLGKRAVPKRAKKLDQPKRQPRVAPKVKMQIRKTTSFFQFPGCRRITIKVIRKMSKKLNAIKEAVCIDPVLKNPDLPPPQEETFIYERPQEFVA